jgi:dTDP-4-dehydrorhamnose reductase
MREPRSAGPDRPEVWAGIECTINRVGDRFVDQCAKNGHEERLDDLERFAMLGIERIRYPFLWEKAAPESPDAIDRSWADERMAELRRVGLRPIAGLLHHGSGPKWTSLVDPKFPEKFATYAAAFARRFPDVTDYTPINEPLTTARFSALYGVWYPHARNDRKFVRGLYQQARATTLAMRAIREINPEARLIQTEDLGRATSTRKLAYQVAFENERRWLSFDLLTGKVHPGHKLYRWLLKHGVSEDELDWMVEWGTPPDVVGINHYLLSNRYLDDRLKLYPEHLHGGNGRHRYADVGAVDTGAASPPSPESVFLEAWERYRLPLAITEVHVAGPREAQMRWLAEIWETGLRLRERGVDLRAVTAWSLLGSFDWNSLCTKCDRFYESGVFDVRSPRPRPTALAAMVRGLAREGRYEHPALDGDGWWKTPGRARFASKLLPVRRARPSRSGRPILITGANGTLGRAFARICEIRGLAHRVVSREEMDIADERSVRSCLDGAKPWAVINTAGYVRVDDAEEERERCFRENVVGAELLARETALRGIPLIGFSSDLVFDGRREHPYTETCPPSPLNVYGESKAESERRMVGENPAALVVRTSSFFGPWDDSNFVTSVLRAVASGRPIPVATDLVVSPTYVPDLVHATLDLLIDGEAGVIHLVNAGRTSWHDFATSALRLALKEDALSEIPDARELILPQLSADMGFRARRPAFAALETDRARILPPVEEALERYFRDLEVLILPMREGPVDARTGARTETWS